ncbi:MAG TPA: hypothetical protein VGE21_15250 [Flavobacteriales bacterium]
MKCFTLLALLGVIGCGSSERSVDIASLERYSNDPENGLVRKRTVNGITTSIRILPSELCALREFRMNGDSCANGLETLLAQHRGQVSMTLTFSPDGVRSKGDIMYSGVADRTAFINRALAMNFDWQERVELRCGDVSYHPVLSTLENTYGLTEGRNIVLVFAPASLSDTALFASPELDLVLHDDHFGTGTQHFKFDRSDIEKVPQPKV